MSLIDRVLRRVSAERAVDVDEPVKADRDVCRKCGASASKREEVSGFGRVREVICGVCGEPHGERRY